MSPMTAGIFNTSARACGGIDAAEDWPKLEDDERQTGSLGNGLVVVAHDGRVEGIVEKCWRGEHEQRVGARVTRGPSVSRRLRGAWPTDPGHDQAAAGSDLARRANHLGPLIGRQIWAFSGINIHRQPDGAWEMTHSR